jgi:hypothetical protein
VAVDCRVDEGQDLRAGVGDAGGVAQMHLLVEERLEGQSLKAMVSAASVLPPLVWRSGAQLPEPTSVQGSTTTGGGLKWGEHYIAWLVRELMESEVAAQAGAANGPVAPITPDVRWSCCDYDSLDSP